MTDIMREWNEALTAPKCEHGHLVPVCDLCKKAAEIERLTAERDAAFAMSRCECATDEACAELAKLRDQLHLAEVVRASQVEGLTQGAAGWRERANQLEAEVAGLLEVVESAAAADEYYDQPPAIQRLATMARIALAARKGTT